MPTAAGAVKTSTTIAAGALPKVSHGQGGYVFDADGKQYIDGSWGPAVYSIGYGNEEVIAAIHDQLNRVMHGYRYTFTSDPLAELTALSMQSVSATLTRWCSCPADPRPWSRR
ncbi:aminotransferase class III-fold pyridoxal phosphate-dependent enzyme [Mesorhizobium sp. M0590]|uniref:aminotransferase class III-fold pyridoxal phosphate-dependent enzyme n=1 Tax=Mesorhizobium sp. M0590 TaxID=2956966 RepID=UPI00333DAED6